MITNYQVLATRNTTSQASSNRQCFRFVFILLQFVAHHSLFDLLTACHPLFDFLNVIFKNASEPFEVKRQR